MVFEKILRIFKVPSAEELRHDDYGREVLDPTPIALPAGLKRPPTLQEQVARLVRSESARVEAARQGKGTFDEEDDFDDPEDDPKSPYELHFDPLNNPAGRRVFTEEKPDSKKKVSHPTKVTKVSPSPAPSPSPQGRGAAGKADE